MNRTDPRMRGFKQRAEVAAVEKLLSDRITALPGETIQLRSAAGRVLSEDVVSPCNVPDFDRSAMDGYALKGEDTFGATEYAPARLRVIGTAMPSRAFAGMITHGEAVRIMTGAPVPPGADAVLMAEDARAEGDQVDVCAAVSPGKNVGKRGEDIRAGERLFQVGRVLRPQDLGVLASTGVASVAVFRSPRVDIIATGNELLPAGSKASGHHIVDANSPMLQALIERDGGSVVGSRIVADDRDAIRAAISACAGDAVLICGGSSVGVEDHVPQIVAELGELPIHGIAMRPSSPAGIGFIGSRPIFLLPGNPVSCLCAYDFFAGPSIRALGGRSRNWPYRTVELPLARKVVSESGRVDYLRVRIVEGAVEPLMTSGASILSSTTKADGVVVVERDREGFAEGTVVTVHLYG
jgi:molybdopterin molybdotransferase